MNPEKRYYVYIMASKSRVIYTGITGSITRRVLQHKAGEIEGFTKRYKINRLVYSESFKYVNNAIARETEIKKWNRAKKLALIERLNPTWEDLAADWGQQIPHGLAPVRNDKTLDEDEEREVPMTAARNR